MISNARYEMAAGDVYVINNLEHHYAFSDGSLDLLVIVFDPMLIWQNHPLDYDYLKPFFERKVTFSNRVEVSNPLSHTLGMLMKEMEAEYREKNTGYQLIIKFCRKVAVILLV